jgi:hypothetical protein
VDSVRCIAFARSRHRSRSRLRTCTIIISNAVLCRDAGERSKRINAVEASSGAGAKKSKSFSFANLRLIGYAGGGFAEADFNAPALANVAGISTEGERFVGALDEARAGDFKPGNRENALRR